MKTLVDYKMLDDSKISMIILVITYFISIQIINILCDCLNKKNEKNKKSE